MNENVMNKNKFILYNDDIYEEDELEEFESDVDITSDKWLSFLSEEYKDKLRKEYYDWHKKRKLYDISKDELKESLISDLEFVSKMSVEEYTLYQKYLEIKEKYPNKNTSNAFKKFIKVQDVVSIQYNKVTSIKNDIWIPASVDDYLKLDPVIEWTENMSELNSVWNILRTFTHTQKNNTNIGRNLFFIVKDRITNKYLGVIAVSSDFLDLTPRDNYIGWERKLKTEGMINHTAIGSTICPTQPLGFNYVGGKLIALLTLSDVIENTWNNVYDRPDMPSKLVAMTTTSLYSSFSQYQNLKYWKKRGHSSGSIKFEPSKKTLDLVKKYLQTNHPLKYWEWYIAVRPSGMPIKRDFKQRSLAYIYRQFNIDKSLIETNHTRGIYFCTFYENSREFLRNEITQDELIRKKDFKNSVSDLTDLWKNKYAQKRVKSLLNNNRLDLNSRLFYDDIIIMDWEKVKEKYLYDVGR